MNSSVIIFTWIQWDDVSLAGTIYIDIGFWGFWLWMLLYMPVRSWAMAKWQDVEGGILCCCAGLFVLLTAMTDNTINYTYVTGSLAISVMSYRLEALEGD